MMITQPEFCDRNPDERLFLYWRGGLKGWLDDMWTYRHNLHMIGRLMVYQGLIFARLLLYHGKMKNEEFIRWKRLHRRVMRWHSKEGKKI